jgi:hypothetical protein
LRLHPPAYLEIEHLKGRGAASLYHELFEQSSIEMEGTGTHLEYLKSSIDLLNEPSTNLRMND